MNRLRGKSPKLPDPKLPGFLKDLRVPPFLKDVYYDLRDRRLLPLIALLLVAIVAVPFLLGGGSDEPADPTAAEESTIGSAGASASSLTVVQSNPGLRDYRRRLAGREATDPFKQRYTHVSLGGAQLNAQTEGGGGEGTSGGTVTETTVTESSGGGSVETDVTVESDGADAPKSPSAPSQGDGDDGEDAGDGEDGPKGELTFYAFAIDVRIVKAGSGNPGTQRKKESTVKERVLPLTQLPGEKAPVVTYMGAASGGKKALLMVSNDVKSVFGDGKCVTGDDVCQLLEVEPGFPESFVYGFNETRYTINVLKIEPVVTGHG